MNERRPSDLVCQMRLLIAEEAYLWELAQQVTEYIDKETWVAHGPWRAADCQQVLARWHDRGLVDCIAVSWVTKVVPDEVVHFEYDADWRTRATEVGQHLVLAREDAAALLSDPSTWQDGDGSGVMLCASDQADGFSFDDWFANLTGLPDHLIYDDGASGSTARVTPAELEIVRTARLWTDAIEHAGTNGLPRLCPINQDADLVFDWEPTNSETATSQAIGDVFWFLDRAQIGPGQPFPFGRHRLWCPACGAEQYLVVTRKPG